MRRNIAALVLLASCFENAPNIDESGLAAIYGECDRDLDCKEGLSCGTLHQCTIIDCRSNDCVRDDAICDSLSPEYLLPECYVPCAGAESSHCDEEELPDATCSYVDQIAGLEVCEYK